MSISEHLSHALNEKWAAIDSLDEARAMISSLRSALQDIADAESIPNDADAFVWCRDVARDAIATARQETRHGE